MGVCTAGARSKKESNISGNTRKCLQTNGGYCLQGGERQPNFELFLGPLLFESLSERCNEFSSKNLGKIHSHW